MTTRYPGVTSFTDSNLAHQLFFGRTEDQKKLFYYILSESLTVLYSKSGYGKTSLLQAGVFKMLRDENCYPFYIRFNKKDTAPEEIIKLEILEKMRKEQYDVTHENHEATLEKFFSELEIWSPANKLITPVLVFDQFEEIFTLEHNYSYRTNFIDQLSGILRKAKEGRLSIKIVLSLREDYLGHLEKLAIKIPSIFSNRFRLEALTLEAAKEAIVQPGEIELENVIFDSPKICFQPDALAELLNFLSLKFIEKEWVETNEIEPVQLQIICSTLEERAINLMQNKLQTEYLITKEILGGTDGLRQILVSFYDTQLHKVTQQQQLSGDEIKALQHLVEEELIINGKRVPKEYESILTNENIREPVLRSLIDQKLLKVENFQSNKLVEISHDTLVEPILMSKEMRRFKQEEERRIKEEEKRLKRERKRRNVLLFTLVGVVVLFMGFFAKHFSEEDSIPHTKIDSARVQERITSAALKAADSVAKKMSFDFFGKSIRNSKDSMIRVNANNALDNLLKAQQIDTAIIIKYFIKKADRELNVENAKLSYALRLIGYINVLDVYGGKESLKTNALFYGEDVDLLNLKIILLTLIRGGVEIQYMYNAHRGRRLVQIIHSEKANIHPVYTVEKVVNAKSVESLINNP